MLLQSTGRRGVISTKRVLAMCKGVFVAIVKAVSCLMIDAHG